MTVQDRNRLVEQHASLAGECAARFLRGIPHDRVDVDAIRGAAREALVKAADWYDDRRGTFRTFAWHRMWGAMRDELRKADHLTRHHRKVLDAAASLHERLGREATTDELAAETGMTIETVERLRRRSDASPLRLEQPVGGGITLADTVAAAGDFTETVCDRLAFQSVFAGLPRREQLVLQLRFADGLTGEEVAVILGVSESRISQLQTSAVKRMRTMLAQGPQPAARRAAA